MSRFIDGLLVAVCLVGLGLAGGYLLDQLVKWARS